MTDEDGMKLGELEGIVGEEDGYTAESDAAILLQGLDIADEAARPQDERIAGRTESPRPAGAGLCSAIRRPCCSTSLRTTSIWIRSTGCRDF